MNILDLDEDFNEEVQIYYPKISQTSNKMVYLTQSSQVDDLMENFRDDHSDEHSESEEEHSVGESHHQKYLSSRLIIIPFLHDRKIYFNRSLATMEYFQFSIQQDGETLMVFMNLSMMKYSIYD